MQQLRANIQGLLSEQFTGDRTQFFTQNPLVSVIGVLVIFYWIVTILWTIKDISSRTNNVIGQIAAILLVGVLSPFIGLPLYLLLRPIKYKWDRIGWRESMAVQTATCPSCGMKNPLHHEFCTNCAQKMLIDCKECKAPYHWIYDYCPQCGAPNVE